MVESQHDPDNAHLSVIAVGSSAGGLAALFELLSTLPEDLGAAVVAVQHLDPLHKSVMAELLDRRTALEVKQATHGAKLRIGSVLIAPPANHMLVEPDGSIALTKTKLVHFVRPSIDLLFESVAATYGERAIAVVLTGSGVDGAQGTVAIKKRGGTVIAQDEESSQHFSMPHAAIATGCVDSVLPLKKIAAALLAIVAEGKT